MKCDCGIKNEEKLYEIERQVKEGLITVYDAAEMLGITPMKMDRHMRKHTERVKSKDLVRIVMKVKADLLDTYEELMSTLNDLKGTKDPVDIRLKIELSKEIRSLKKDLNDFIKRHSMRIAAEHEDLERQWRKMAEFMAHDACNKCRLRLINILKDDEID